MKKIVQVRVDGDAWEDLKILATLDGRLIGDYLARLIRAEVAREEKKSGKKRESWGA